MAQGQVATTQVGSRTVYTLRHTVSGAEARILPSYGFNLYDLRLPVGGEVLPIVVTSDGWAENPSRPGGNGTPVLFPFPNRIRDATYEFEGKTYTLPANNGPNAIHGFAIDAPWEVVDAGSDERGAFIEGQYQISRHTPDRLEQWPSDAVLTIRYTLMERGVELAATVTNPTETPLPFGFGIHPYFRLPFKPGTDLAKGKVILPAAAYWELADFLPTGARKPVEPELDFRDGKVMTGLKADNVLTGLIFEGSGADAECVCRLIDESLGGEFQIRFGTDFRELVVYTPRPGGDVIAVEPYTMVTDAINLEPRGIDAGLRVLPHDGTASFSIVMQTS